MRRRATINSASLAQKSGLVRAKLAKIAINWALCVTYYWRGYSVKGEEEGEVPLYSSIIILSMHFAGPIIFYKSKPIVSHVHVR